MLRFHCPHCGYLTEHGHLLSSGLCLGDYFMYYLEGVVDDSMMFKFIGRGRAKSLLNGWVHPIKGDVCIRLVNEFRPVSVVG